ncbi:DUF4279 domain-containing protein [bacterium]|jgi:hypothetical protein|nr:DUF4279 domain-containing protein [bacterium]
MPYENYREKYLRYQRRVRWNEVFVHFGITSRKKSVLEISKELELAPSYFTNKGDKIAELDLVSDCTIWTLTTERFVNSQDVNDHLDKLAEKLFGRSPALRRFQAAGLEMEIVIAQYIWTDSYSLSPKPQTLEFFSRYGIRLKFYQSHYSGNPDEHSVFRKP